MAADNKMWEGHRMILPEARDRFTRSVQKAFARPAWDEQRLEELERLLDEALHAKTPVLLTLWSAQGPYKREVVVLKKEIKRGGPVLRCRDKADYAVGIACSDILEITPVLRSPQ